MFSKTRNRSPFPTGILKCYEGEWLYCLSIIYLFIYYLWIYKFQFLCICTFNYGKLVRIKLICCNLLWFDTQSTQYGVTCRAPLIVYTNNGGMNRQSNACQKKKNRQKYIQVSRCTSRRCICKLNSFRCRNWIKNVIIIIIIVIDDEWYLYATFTQPRGVGDSTYW